VAAGAVSEVDGPASDDSGVKDLSSWMLVTVGAVALCADWMLQVQVDDPDGSGLLRGLDSGDAAHMRTICECMYNVKSNTKTVFECRCFFSPFICL
jgi:hypothetical protein